MRPVKNKIQDPRVGQKYRVKKNPEGLCPHSEVEITAIDVNRRALTYKYLTGPLHNPSHSSYERYIEDFLKSTTLSGGN